MVTYYKVDELIGVATSERTSPIIVPRSLNMSFRVGTEPRYGVRGLQTVFDDEADRVLFEQGVVQKVLPYQTYGLNPAGLLFLISGTLFFGAMSGAWMYVTKLFTGLRKDLTLGWGVQGFEWAVIQNGVDRPIIWDGHAAAFQSDPSKQEMPIGSIMTFIHHTIAVASADGTDKIAISDQWRQTESSNLWKFTNTPTWASGGVFGLHINMGKLMWMVAIPQVKQTPNGQGDLLLGGTYGMQTLNLQVPLNDRINSQIQDTALVGTGGASYLGVLPYRSGIWFIGHDGLHEFRHTQNDFYRSDADVTESSDIGLYWDQSNSNMRAIQPLGQHNNHILIGLYPEMETNDYGFHRFHAAWASLDLSEKWRGGVKLPKRHDGLQCAIRPVEWSTLLVNRISRTFCTSWDADGKNRVYEMTDHLPYDLIEGKPKAIVSFFDTPPLSGQPKVMMAIKKPLALRVDYEAATGDVKVETQVGGENENCWNIWGEFCARPSTDAISSPCLTTPPHRGVKIIGDPRPTPCFRPPPSVLRARVRMTGRARIGGLLAKLEIPDGSAPDGLSGELFSESCGSCADAPRRGVDCCEDHEIYHLTP